MEICTRDSGTTIRETEKENFPLETEGLSQVHSRMMKPTMENSSINMKTHSKMILTREAISCMANLQDSAKLNSPTRMTISENLEMEWWVAKVSLLIRKDLMELRLSTQGISEVINAMAMVKSFGATLKLAPMVKLKERCLKVSGTTIKRSRESSRCKMGLSTMENGWMTTCTGKGNLPLSQKRKENKV
jgi:hypothetical protein